MHHDLNPLVDFITSKTHHNSHSRSFYQLCSIHVENIQHQLRISTSAVQPWRVAGTSAHHTATSARHVARSPPPDCGGGDVGRGRHHSWDQWLFWRCQWEIIMGSSQWYRIPVIPMIYYSYVYIYVYMYIDIRDMLCQIIGYFGDVVIHMQ
jgi:hypothetical protein